jgi:hypothetical protein
VSHRGRVDCPHRRHDTKGVRGAHPFLQLYQSHHYLNAAAHCLNLIDHYCSINASLAPRRRSARRTSARDCGSRGRALGLRQRQRQAGVLRERISQIVTAEMVRGDLSLTRPV